MVKHVRYYVNTGKWLPTREEWLHLTSCISQDEVDRINKFYYKDDAKPSLIGRALIRKFISEATGRPSNEAQLIRSDLGRPEVCNNYKLQLGASYPRKLDFNVSHSGDYCTLAGFWSDSQDDDYSIGIDVTKVVSKRTHEELSRFLDLMSRREFTEKEWETVENATGDRQKSINFTRLWCLKECFIKSIGLGLKFRLNRITFEPNQTNRYHLDIKSLKGRMIDDTRVTIDNKLGANWRFLETALDDEHLVAIGYCNLNQNEDYELDKEPLRYLKINDLINSLQPITPQAEGNWFKFDSKTAK